jgi:hypothetical protein
VNEDEHEFVQTITGVWDVHVCRLDGDLPDLIDRFGGPTVSKGFQRADFFDDLIDLG